MSSAEKQQGAYTAVNQAHLPARGLFQISAPLIIQAHFRRAGACKISPSFTLKTKSKKIGSSQRERAFRIQSAIKETCRRFPGLSRVFKWCRDQDFYLHATKASSLPCSSGEDGGVGAADRPGTDNEEATAESTGSAQLTET